MPASPGIGRKVKRPASNLFKPQKPDQAPLAGSPDGFFRSGSEVFQFRFTDFLKCRNSAELVAGAVIGVYPDIRNLNIRVFSPEMPLI